jgi:hypothetical protein
VLFFYVALIVFFWEHNLSFNENLTITIYWKSLHGCFLIHRYKRDQTQRKITKLQECYMIVILRTLISVYQRKWSAVFVHCITSLLSTDRIHMFVHARKLDIVSLSDFEIPKKLLTQMLYETVYRIDAEHSVIYWWIFWVVFIIICLHVRSILWTG